MLLKHKNLLFLPKIMFFKAKMSTLKRVLFLCFLLSNRVVRSFYPIHFSRIFRLLYPCS